jgi:hypothetical protein
MLPVLSAIAKFLVSNGARKAAIKYGKQAVELAKKEIKKRESKITDASKKASRSEKDPEFGELHKPIQLTRDAAKGATRAVDRRTDTKSDLFREPNPEIPLKLKKGGKVKRSKPKVRGAGIARKGVRPAKMR